MRNLRPAIVSALFVAATVAATLDAQDRKWTRNDGYPPVEGKAIGAADGFAIIALADGRTVEVPLASLDRESLDALASAVDAKRPTIHGLEESLRARTLASIAGELEGSLKKSPLDDRIRFALGTVRALRSIERYFQATSRMGAENPDSDRTFLLFVAYEPHREAKPATYAAVRAALETLANDLGDAEATLAEIRDDFQFSLRLSDVRFDVDDDGSATDLFLPIAVRTLSEHGRSFPENPRCRVDFDRSDAYWIRAMCRVVQGCVEASLAYDWEPAFDRYGSQYFEQIERREGRPAPAESDAAILTLADPDRLERARRHFIDACLLYEEAWRLAKLESDREFEWLPAPAQQGALNQATTVEQANRWPEIAAEARAILEGDRSISQAHFGRSGIDLKSFLGDPPKEIDLARCVVTEDGKKYLDELLALHRSDRPAVLVQEWLDSQILHPLDSVRAFVERKASPITGR